MTDPFSLDEVDDDISSLIKIATDVGLRMPFALNELLVRTLRLALIGQITKFVEQTLNTNNTTFWDSLPNLKIKTFASLVKKKTVKLVYDKVLVINADRELFGRLVIAAKSRVINLIMSLARSCQQSLEKMVDVQLKLPQVTTSTIYCSHIRCYGARTYDKVIWRINLWWNDIEILPADHCCVGFERLSSGRCCVWPILQSFNQSWREGETRCVYGLGGTNMRTSHSCSKAVAKVFCIHSCQTLGGSLV